MDYKQVVIGHVQRSVGAVNDIVVSLQRDHPFSSDILDVNYSQATVDEFHKSSQIVADALRAASETTSIWFKQTGDNISENLASAGRVEAAIQDMSLQLLQANEYAQATQDRINYLHDDINNGQANLNSAQHELDNARSKLQRERRKRDTARIGAVASLFFAPVLSIALATVSFTALEDAVDNQKDAVHAVESQLGASRAQLQAQQEQLAREQAESTRLSSRVSELQKQANTLSAEVRALESARAELTVLSKRINDCLHTVNTALSSSETITAMSSMRNVVSGIRGVVSALKKDDMFTGPLAQLDDGALGALDRRVASIKRSRLMV